MLSQSVRDGIMYGALVLPVIGGLWIWRRRRAARWEIPETLPKASVGSGRDIRKLVVRALPMAAIVVGLGMSIWARAHSRKVLRLTDRGVERNRTEIDPVAAI